MAVVAQPLYPEVAWEDEGPLPILGPSFINRTEFLHLRRVHCKFLRFKGALYVGTRLQHSINVMESSMPGLQDTDILICTLGGEVPEYLDQTFIRGFSANELRRHDPGGGETSATRPARIAILRKMLTLYLEWHSNGSPLFYLTSAFFDRDEHQSSLLLCLLTPARKLADGPRITHTHKRHTIIPKLGGTSISIEAAGLDTEIPDIKWSPSAKDYRESCGTQSLAINHTFVDLGNVVGDEFQ
ncbi:hypothetical protein FB451DRAFT_1481738 [Mycena latifolia]|nr:hypothetical protein FB451DRAFT_1481738 [Mycena latifolia]